MAHRLLLSALVLFLPLAAGAAHAADDSCDIAALPAATLLLPYFEVDLDDPNGETTLFTVVNVTSEDRIAHVTLWTDRAFPVIDFNIYLTGYDVQSINLYDVLARGIIGSTRGTGTTITKRGKFSDPGTTIDLSACASLPGELGAADLARVQDAFTLGITSDCSAAGGMHDHAIGYATIDVVGTCATHFPTERAYWARDIAYDNVLTGDYQQVSSAAQFAQSGPLVHIRTVENPERTFYGRYQSDITPTRDRRQALPTNFAARWISGSTADFETSMKVWREGRTGIDADCADYGREGHLAVAELVVFDESENAVTAGAGLLRELPATSRTDVASSDVYPQLPNGANAGWVYFNLDASRRDDAGSQAWVIASMRAEQRYSTDIAATAFGNACAAPAEPSEITEAGGAPIAPAQTDDSCEIAQLPAATLLLPYFEVDLRKANGETTLFTVTNVSPVDQIARVTLWTDYAFPVITFNIYLTGYDVQSINLYDVIARGIIASSEGTGTRVTERGAYSDRNIALDLGQCGRLPGALDNVYVTRMQHAFTEGVVPDFGSTAGCQNVGNEHEHAIGYATIDVVRNCEATLPTSPDYWSDDIAYANVLAGDYQQLNASTGAAQGNPLVHIRALDDAPRHTFYERYQSAAADPRGDRRQPLPSLFAARWVQGAATSFETSFKIWRQINYATAKCNEHDDQVVEIAEIVRFDEAENAVGYVPPLFFPPLPVHGQLPVTSRTIVSDSDIYPQLTNGAIGGWMYLNLDNRKRQSSASQNWVTVTMRAEGRYSVEHDATAMSNGCAPPTPTSEITTAGGVTIGPRP